MLPMNTMLTTLVPEAHAILTIGAGAMAALAVLVVLAVTMAFGVARELRRADGPSRTDAAYPVRAAGAARLAA